MHPRDPAGAWKTFAAVAYAIASTTCGLCCIARGNLSVSGGVAAVFALAHGRIIAAYLVHECAHSSIFFERRWNTALGVAMLWVSGCPYCDFQHVKRLHVAHHIDRADTTSFHYKAELRALPRAIKGTVLAMEYCLVPIIEMLMHVRVALRPLVALHDPKVTARHRATAAVGSVAVATIWLGLFACGGMYALAQYAAAAILMLHVLSAHDAFQHTYIVLTDDDTYVPGPGDRTAQYEDSNTYSNLISVNYPLLNLLSLNFGYHNAHHAKPMSLWYTLPAIHEAIYGSEALYTKGGGSLQVVPMRELMGTWFWNRIPRAIEDDYGVVGSGQGRADTFIGSLGVSFLTV